jgi:hypothetical protein
LRYALQLGEVLKRLLVRLLTTHINFDSAPFNHQNGRRKPTSWTQFGLDALLKFWVYTDILRPIRLICALVFAAVILFLAGLHVYWALGGKWGSFATIPTIDGHHTINPTPLATLVVALLLVIGAVTICGQAGLFVTGSWSPLFRFGAWCLCGVFLLRTVGNLKTFGFFKTVHGTPFAYWDTRLYSPLCLVLATLAALVASGRD